MSCFSPMKAASDALRRILDTKSEKSALVFHFASPPMLILLALGGPRSKFRPVEVEIWPVFVGEILHFGAGLRRWESASSGSFDHSRRAASLFKPNASGECVLFRKCTHLGTKRGQRGLNGSSSMAERITFRAARGDQSSFFGP
jgi:hypothetical protein